MQIAIDDISAVVEANFQVRGFAGMTLCEGRAKIALSGSMTIFANLRYLDGQAIDICDGDFGVDSFHVDMAGAFKGTTEPAVVQAVISNIIKPLVRENAASMVCEGRVSPMLRFLGPSVEVDWSSTHLPLSATPPGHHLRTPPLPFQVVHPFDGRQKAVQRAR